MKYASQIFGDALRQPMKADSKKLSSLEPGQIVRTVDGSAYRVSSKTASPKGIAYKLADLQGKPVPTPADFRPVGIAMSRFASWLRYHLAYNKDFDLYVNSYIEKHNSEHPDNQLPYPAGPDGKPFRWSDWFQRSIAPKLYVNGDPGQAQAMKDEVIHEMLFTVLGTRSAIDKFAEKIKRFNKNDKVKNMSVAHQLTVYLTTIFSHKHRLMEMQGLLKEQQPEQEMSMIQPGMGEEGDETSEQNILDTEEHAVGTEAFQSAEAEKDIAKFRDTFGHWLKGKYSEKVANSFLTLFDIYWQLIAQSGNDDVQDVDKSEKQKKKDERKSWMISRSDLEPLWAERTGLSFGSMKDYLGRLPALMEEFITSHATALGNSNIFVSLMNAIKKETGKAKAKPAKASSLKVAEEEDIQKQMNAEYAIHGKSDKWFKLRDQSHNRKPEKAAAGVEGDFSQALRNSENPDVVDQDIKQPTESVSDAAGVKQGADNPPDEGPDYYDFPKNWKEDEKKQGSDEYEDHVRRNDPHASPNAQANVSPEDASAMLAAIRPGDRVTIMRPAGMGRGGQEWAQATGRAVMRSSHGGWVLNLGGKHGTPGLVDEQNIVSVRKGKKGSAKTAKLIAGADLAPEMRQQVLNSFPYRWTHENDQRLSFYKPCPSCDIKNPHVDEQSNKGHNHPTIPLISDDQWIREHSFNFTLDGRLGRGHAQPAYLAQHNARRVASVDLKFAVEKAAYNPGMAEYIYNADIYCENCANDIKKELSTSGNVPSNLDETQYDSDVYPKGPYYNQEADSPQHCGRCGRFLENPLTRDGYAYVERALADYDPTAGHSDVLQEWRDFYSDSFEPEESKTSAETGNYACCGGRDTHKEGCSVQGTDSTSKHTADDRSEPVDMTDEHAINQSQYKPPLDALNLWLEKAEGQVHISMHDEPQTFCGKTIGYHESHTQDANRMIPTSVLEIEETMNDDVWCPYCLDDYDGPGFLQKEESEHIGSVEKEAMIGHMFNDADGQAIRNETNPNTGAPSGISDATELNQPRVGSGTQDCCGAFKPKHKENCKAYADNFDRTTKTLGLKSGADEPKKYVRTDGVPFESNVSYIAMGADGEVWIAFPDGRTEQNSSLDSSMLEDMIRRGYVKELKQGAGSNSGKDDARGAGDNWREEFYESSESGPSADALGLTTAGKTADSSGSTTTTMQNQNATFPGTGNGKEPMAVPEAIDQAPGPHSPNAPSTAPRTPTIRPAIVDVPAGTVGDDSNMAVTGSEDADWESMHPEENVEDDEAYDCPKCRGMNTEVEEEPDGGYHIYCNDCDEITEVVQGEAVPQGEREGFRWHGQPPHDPSGDFSDEENDKFKTFMKSLGASRKTAGEETYEVFVRDWWRMERGRKVPNPGGDEEQLATGLTYEEARDMCEEYASTHEPGELSRKAEFRGEGNASDDDEEKSAYTIYGKYKGNTEEIDTAEDQQSAEYLVGEYKLAYGQGWEIWFEDAQGNRGDMPSAPGMRDLNSMREMGIRGSKNDDELMEEAEITLRKQGVTAPATVSPNVVQNQSIRPPAQVQGQNPVSVALMPGQQPQQDSGGGSGYGEDQPSKRTIQPELTQSEFLMREGSVSEGLYSLVAAEMQKLGGGTDFWTKGTGKTPQEAFRQAVDQARYESGHGGYSGTISEKDGFVLLRVPQGVKPGRYAEWVASADHIDNEYIEGEKPGTVRPFELFENKKVEIKAGSKCPKCKKGKVEMTQPEQKEWPGRPGQTYTTGGGPKCMSCGANGFDLYSQSTGSGDAAKYYTYKRVPVKLDPALIEQLKRDGKVYGDKHGPAAAVQLSKNEWLFFGIASS